MVPIQATLSFVLIGSAAVAAGVVGMRLPAGDRISAGLTLLVGAGVGVISLATGMDLSEGSPPETFENVFLISSALGFVATIASLALLWRWSGSRRGTDPAEPGAADPAGCG